MSGNPVKKPAVVRDHYRAAGKILQALFKRPERININVVGGLIQEQDVRLFLKRHGQMQAIALSSRKRTTFFFLIGTGKIKTRQKSTHVDVTSPHPYGFITAGHHLVNSFLRRSEERRVGKECRSGWLT